MSENKYLCSPNSDMSILFEHVFGVNFTRAVISGETPENEKWVQPLFSSRTEALMFQDILINQLSIAETPTDKLETQLMDGDMYYAISMAVLLKLRQNVDFFLQSAARSMKVEGDHSVLGVCGIGVAGVARLYNNFGLYITPEQIVSYLDALEITNPSTLKLYLTSNASAAQRNYTFENMKQLHEQFASNLRSNNTILASLIGTKGSLATEVYKVLHNSTQTLQHDFSNTEVYGYLFPFLPQGAEAYGVDESGSGLSKWKTLSMAAMVTVYTAKQEYYQQVPVRRSLTKVKITGI